MSTSLQQRVSVDQPRRLPLAGRGPVNGRSVLLGLLGVGFICGLTPYNNYVVNNTDLVGNFLPCGLLLFFLTFVLLINAPLSRWAPRHALSSGELAVALGMILVSCALPAVGLMRYLPGHLVSFFAHASESGEYRRLLAELNLPDWLFPRLSTSSLIARGNDPVVRDFMGRAPVDEHTLAAQWLAVPWGAWVTPALTWGVFLAALFGAILCLSVIFRRQWVENERLPYPLASVYLSVIEAPPPGRALNRLFRSRRFWIAFAVVFALHAINALSRFWPKYWPAIPLGFDFGSLFVEEPLKYTEWGFKAQKLSLTIVGITFFVQGNLAFSLWFFFVAVQAARMIYGTYQSELTFGMEVDQIFGAMIPFGVVILWVGRHHLLLVARQMRRGARDNEAQDGYLPYAAAGWGLIVCLIGLVTWLVLAGASLAGAVVLVLMLMWMYLVLAKVVADTGLLYVLIPVPLNRPWVYALNELPQALATRTTMGSYFFASMFSGMLTHDLRQSLPVYATHALRVGDLGAYSQQSNWRRAIPFTVCLVLALAVGYGVSGAASLYVHYSYAVTLDRQQEGLDHDGWGWYRMPRDWALNHTRDYLPPRTGPVETHSRLGHFTFGAALTGVLSVLRLRYAGWPLHPVGYLLAYTWGIRVTWFSIFVGWLLKVLVVRLGGAGLFERSRDLFLGMVVGESVAAAFWLIVSLLCAWAGADYVAIQLMPT